MKHARSDYNRIQDPAGLIPEDEPVFLLRGKDLAAPAAIEHWAELVLRMGGDGGITRAAIEHAAKMRVWQLQNGAQIPDAPAEALGI